MATSPTPGITITADGRRCFFPYRYARPFYPEDDIELKRIDVRTFRRS